MRRHYREIAILAVVLSQTAVAGMTYKDFRSLSSLHTNDVPLIGYTVWSISQAPTVSVSLVENMDPKASEKTMENLRGLSQSRATNAFDSLSFVDDPPQAQKHIFLHVVEGTREAPTLLLISRFGRALTSDKSEKRNRVSTVAANFKNWFSSFALPELRPNNKEEEELPTRRSTRTADPLRGTATGER